MTLLKANGVAAKGNAVDGELSLAGHSKTQPRYITLASSNDQRAPFLLGFVDVAGDVA